MAEFIGSRISLISKRDIRYVGTLHKIDSENSTVALEKVVSFGTEGRRPEDEVPPTDTVYDYIVFRGSDVKDLRIEETPKENQPPKPQVPDDPAILGSGRGPTSPPAEPAPPEQPPQITQTQNNHQAQQPPQNQQAMQPQKLPNNPQSYQFQQRQESAPRFPQQPMPFYYPPPPNQRFGPQGFPHPAGYPVMPYGTPPAWFPPGQGYHYPPLPPGQFYPPQPPIGPNVQQNAQVGPQAVPTNQGPAQSQSLTPAQVAAVSQSSPPSQLKAPAISQAPVTQKASAPPVDTINGHSTPPQTKLVHQPELEQQVQHQQQQLEEPEKPIATVRLPSKSTTPAPPQVLPTLVAQNGPPLPTSSKPDTVAALAPPAVSAGPDSTTAEAIPTGPKNGRIMPVIPRLSPAFKAHVPANGTLQAKSTNAANQSNAPVAKLVPGRSVQTASNSVDDATRDARAAVAAAMAKLSPAPGTKVQIRNESNVGNLSEKMNELRTRDNSRTPRQPGPNHTVGHRGRGGYRGGRPHPEQNVRKIEVPTTDYDFALANAKFNKQDLVKAVTAGSSAESPVDGTSANDSKSRTPGTENRHGSQASLIVPSPVSYDKSSSFFDNISSESRDRDEANGKKLGGREYRSEEVKKNFETFGQGSVDNGYRGGFRGRARGRGHGRGRGGQARGGRGQIRGGAGVAAVITEL